jgi:hypothetical protein
MRSIAQNLFEVDTNLPLGVENPQNVIFYHVCQAASFQHSQAAKADFCTNNVVIVN